MVALLVILMAQRAMPIIWHEWLGIILFILLVLRNALNYKWFCLFKENIIK